MHYLIVSFSHKNSSLEMREKLSFDDENKEKCLKKLLQAPSIKEVILLSTCNRTEIITNCDDIDDAKSHIYTLLGLKTDSTRKELEENSEVFDDSTAIHHLFLVASSIDSMVVGETQITGQLKDAFRFSHDKAYSAKKLSRAISHAFKCAAKVRNSTDISSKPVSIASVAIFAIKDVTSLDGKKALVIGVGEMSEIVAKHLVSDGIETYITNRTAQKAEILAKECGAKTYHYGDLDKGVNEFDIIFSATSSSVPIITEDMVESRDFDRFWFDLAIPRDIETQSKNNIYLYAIDDLKSIIDKNISDRQQYVRQAQGIIGRSVVAYFESLDTPDIEPMIKEIYQRAFESASKESNRVIQKGYIPKEYETQVHKMAQQVMKRFLHDITKNIRAGSGDAGADTISGAIQSAMIKHGCEAPFEYKCKYKTKVCE
jgi:glutamyl-tRNA reductase